MYLKKWTIAGLYAVFLMMFTSCQAEPIKPASLRLERDAVIVTHYATVYKEPVDADSK